MTLGPVRQPANGEDATALWAQQVARQVVTVFADVASMNGWASSADPTQRPDIGSLAIVSATGLVYVLTVAGFRQVGPQGLLEQGNVNGPINVVGPANTITNLYTNPLDLAPKPSRAVGVSLSCNGAGGGVMRLEAIVAAAGSTPRMLGQFAPTASGAFGITDLFHGSAVFTPITSSATGLTVRAVYLGGATMPLTNISVEVIEL